MHFYRKIISNKFYYKFIYRAFLEKKHFQFIFIVKSFPMQYYNKKKSSVFL